MSGFGRLGIAELIVLLFNLVVVIGLPLALVLAYMLVYRKLQRIETLLSEIRDQAKGIGPGA